MNAHLCTFWFIVATPVKLYSNASDRSDGRSISIPTRTGVASVATSFNPAIGFNFLKLQLQGDLYCVCL